MPDACLGAGPAGCRDPEDVPALVGGGQAALTILKFPDAYTSLLSFILGLGGLVALCYAAAIAGSEWQWGTLRNAVARGEGRVYYVVVTFLAIILLVGIALLVTFNAAWIATFFSAAADDAQRLPAAITLFAWALPLWAFIETATGAARARRAFGPEIRLRIFWEQIARIAFATGFFFAGATNNGLIIAHLCSLTLTAGLCIPLLGRYYDLKLLLRAPLPKGLVRELVVTGFALLPVRRPASSSRSGASPPSAGRTSSARSSSSRLGSVGRSSSRTAAADSRAERSAAPRLDTGGWPRHGSAAPRLRSSA